MWYLEHNAVRLGSTGDIPVPRRQIMSKGSIAKRGKRAEEVEIGRDIKRTPAIPPRVHKYSHRYGPGNFSITKYSICFCFFTSSGLKKKSDVEEEGLVHGRSS